MLESDPVALLLNASVECSCWMLQPDLIEGGVGHFEYSSHLSDVLNPRVS